MVEIALVFVGLSLLVLLGLLAGSVYFIPKALSEETHADAESPDEPGGRAH